MNRIYRLVWNSTAGMLVPVTESSVARKKNSRARHAMMMSVLLSAAGTANADTFLDLSGGLGGWTSGGNVTLHSTTVTVPTGGATFTLTPAAGYDMARINAPNGGNITSPDATLGLSANSLSSFLNNSNGHITNFGLLTKSFAFNVGTYTFAWAYGAEDYQPYNDGAVFTLAGGGSQTLISLARNGSDPTDLSGPSPDTLILGSYGATPWLITSFDVTVAGTYQVGFGVYNWDDTSLAPNLYVSGIAGTYSGTPATVSGGTLPPAAPPIIGGTGGNVSGSVFDPSSPAYSGTTLEFSGGTLQYTGDTTTAKDATLAGSGGAIDTNGHDVDFTGALSGASDFYKQGEGTLVLTSASNSYTGKTNIDGGTLKLTGAGTVAASSEVVNDGVLDIAAASSDAEIKTLSGNGIVNLGSNNLILTAASGAFDGNFDGTGGVQIEAGTITLNGGGNYSGGVSVSNGGKLIAGNAGALGSSSGTIKLNDGTFANSTDLAVEQPFAVTGSATFEIAPNSRIVTNGSLAGTGDLIKTGTGILELAADNSALGSSAVPARIIVTSGDVLVSNPKGLGNASLVLTGGSLSTSTNITVTQTISIAPQSIVNTSANTVFTFSTPVTSIAGGGNGCFEKQGAGSLVMAGRADIDAGTCVQDGKLYANGTLNSVVTVQTGGTLRGTGTITGPTTVYGRLAPGNSPGTLLASAPVTMAAGSSYQEDINGLGTSHGPGNYSRLVIEGAGNTFVASGATLEPNLVNVTGSDTYVPYVPQLGDAFRIVTAEGGIVGQFDSVTQPEGLEAGTRMEAYYNVANSNSIDLFVVPTSYGAYTKGRAGNLNAQSAAAALDRLVGYRADGSATESQDALLYAVSGQTSASLVNTTTALAGELHGALFAAAPLATRWMTDSIVKQLSYGNVPAGGHGVWVDMGANRSDWESDSFASGFDTTRSQVAIGWDVLSLETSRVGVGFSHGKVDVSMGAGSGSMTQDVGFVYGQAKVAAVFIDAVAAYGDSDWETDRRDPISPVNSLDTDINGRQASASLGVRLPLQVAGFSVAPYARAGYEKVRRDAFDEGSSSLASLNSAAHSDSGLRVTSGVLGGSYEQNPLATRFTYQFNLGVGRDDADLAHPMFDATLAGVTTQVATPEVGRTFGFAQINGTARLSSRIYSHFGVSGETRSGKSEDIGTSLGVRVVF